MRGTTPTLHCDAEDGLCGTWDVDYYAATASTVDGFPITEAERAPGWTVVNGEDRCPAHRVLPPAKPQYTYDHDFVGVAGHPDDDECTHREDGTDATYCGRTRAEHDQAEVSS